MVRPRRATQITAAGLRHTNSEKGSSIVEFAFIVVVLMMMILGIIDFCRAAYSYHFVSEAAREASRWAAVNGETCAGDGSCNGTAPMNNGPATQTDIQTYVTNLTPPGIDSTKITTTANWCPKGANCPATCTTPGPANNPGCTVEVKVSYTFSFIFPLVRTGTLTLSSTSEMIIVH
jgi:Flp pilus assembly protein TadG